MPARKRVTGLGRVQREFHRKLRQVGTAMGQSLVEVGLDLWGKSNELAPKKLGDLRASAYLAVGGEMVAGGEKPPAALMAPNDVRVVEFGYGVPYAERLHEMQPYQDPTTPGTQPKWLEITLSENADRYFKYVEKRTGEVVDD